MRVKDFSPISQIELRFRKEHNEMQDVRGEISTCVVVGNSLFLAYDESSAVERLRWKKGKYKKHKTFELDEFFDLPDGADGEMDIEGLAWEAPWLWVSGSMSLKRDTPDEDDDAEEAAACLATIDTDDNRFTLGKIPCQHNEEKDTWTPVCELDHRGETLRPVLMEGGPRSTVLTELLAQDEHLGAFMSVPCKDNGFDIEGLAVADDRVFLGLRGPVLGGWAVILDFSLHEHDGCLMLDGRGDSAKPYNKHFVNLFGMGLREINIADETGDMYLLAGPTMDLDGTISAWRINGGLADEPLTVCHQPQRLFDIVYGSMNEYGKDKAEGMALLADGNYMIVFDSPVDERLIRDRSVLADVYKAVPA